MMQRAIDNRAMRPHHVLQMQWAGGHTAWQVDDSRLCEELALDLALNQRHLPRKSRKRSLIYKAVEGCVLAPPTLLQVVNTNCGEKEGDSST